MTMLRPLINVDIFTDSYRVSGRVAVTTAGIYGELHNPNSDFLDLNDAYISRIHQPGDIVTSYTQAAFRKQNINFVVLQNRKDGIPVGSRHGQSIFVRGRPYPVFVTIPSFEIQGEILYDAKPTPSGVIIQSMGQFQLIFGATASASLYPDISYSGDLILVHKDRIGIFCLSDDKK
jgi:hypothetical protein